MDESRAVRELILLLGTIALQEGPKPEELIRDLADPSVEVRDRAAGLLLAMGEGVLPALKASRENPDSEVRGRVGGLIWRIEWADMIDPSLLARHPSLSGAWNRGDHEAILAFCRREDRRSIRDTWMVGPFEAYAIKLLDHPNPRLKKAAVEILDRNDYLHTDCRRPVAGLAKLLEEWEPGVWEDPERHWIRTVLKITLGVVSRRDLPLLSSLRPRHRDGLRVLEVVRGSLGDDACQEVLDMALRDGPRWLREIALKAITRTGTRSVFEGALAATQDPGVEERARGECLLRLADPSCASRLVEVFSKTPAELRSWHWYHALVKARAKAAIPLIVQDLDSTVPYVSGYAAAALLDLRATEAAPLLLQKRGNSERGKEFERAGLLLASTETMVGALRDPDPAARRRAAGWLAFKPEPELRGELIRLFDQEGDAEIRQYLFGALCPFGREPNRTEGLDRLVERVASDPRDPLHYQAAIAAVKLDASRWAGLAEKLFLEEVHQATPQTETFLQHLLHALTECPSDRMVEPLVKATQKQNDLTGGVIRYLERLGSVKARGALRELAETHADPGRRMAAAEALAKLGMVVPELILKEGDIIARQGSSWSLATFVRLDAPGVRPALREWVKKHGPYSYLRALEEWSHPEMIPALRKIIENEEVRAVAEPVENKTPTCIPIHDFTARSAAKALAASGDRTSIPYWFERLSSPDPDIREVAVDTLGTWRAGEAVPMLKRLVRSGLPWVRGQAIRALGEIGAPGTQGFLVEHLTENVDAVARALVRLKAVDCIPDLARLVEESEVSGAVLAALDLLSHPDAYSRIEGTVSLPDRKDAKAKLGRLAGVLGVPVRCSDPISEQALGAIPLMEQGTAADCLQAFYARYTSDSGPRLVHLYRRGAVELCPLEEARQYWRSLPKGQR